VQTQGRVHSGDRQNQYALRDHHLGQRLGYTTAHNPVKRAEPPFGRASQPEAFSRQPERRLEAEDRRNAEVSLFPLKKHRGPPIAYKQRESMDA
jgi:hypothetical protein